MVKAGFISEADKNAALAEQLAYGEGATNANTTAPHFAEMVMNQLSEKYGYETVVRSGYQVKTTLDLDVQNALQESVANGMTHINAMGGSNASAMVLDPKTGEIRGPRRRCRLEQRQVGQGQYDDNGAPAGLEASSRFTIPMRWPMA